MRALPGAQVSSLHHNAVSAAARSAAAGAATLEIVARIPGRHFLRNLVTGRALIAQLVRRDFRTRYVGSSAGWLWGVVHPIVQLLIWIMVFKYWFGVTLPADEVTTNYPLFLFCGILPWWLFQETVTRSAGSLVEQSNLITRTVFPSEVVPVSIFLSSMIHHLIAVGLAIFTVGLWQRSLSPMIVLLPIYMFFLGLLAVGVGWVVSSLHVYLRDTAQVLAVAINLWFWITPIMISEKQAIKVPFVHGLVKWNPMSWVVNGYRDRLLSNQWPDWRELAVIAAYSVSVFVLGGLFFRHLKRGFADVL
jgi:homopolymeric O-antigen transport system permease protein